MILTNKQKAYEINNVVDFIALVRAAGLRNDDVVRVGEFRQECSGSWAYQADDRQYNDDLLTVIYKEFIDDVRTSFGNDKIGIFKRKMANPRLFQAMLYPIGRKPKYSHWCPNCQLALYTHEVDFVEHKYLRDFNSPKPGTYCGACNQVVFEYVYQDEVI
jgi:hypothetical protein